MEFGDGATNRHLRSAALRDGVEDFPSGQAKLGSKTMHSVRQRETLAAPLILQRCAFHVVGNERPLSLVLTNRFTHKEDVPQEVVPLATHKHLNRFVGAAFPSLPPRPAIPMDSSSILVLEFSRDEMLGRTVKDGVYADEKALFRADAEEQCDVQAVRIMPERMLILVLLRPVLV